MVMRFVAFKFIKVKDVVVLAILTNKNIRTLAVPPSLGFQ